MSDATPTRTPDEIEAELVATRDRLAGNVDSLAGNLAPEAIAERAVGGVRGFFVDEDGVRTNNVAKAAAVVVGLLLFRGIVRRLS